MPRLFLAIPLDDALRERVTAVQARLAASEADVRWVSPENLHLTIAFLGDQTDGQVGDIASFAEFLAAGTAPFRVGLRGVSAFPRKGPLKTLWVGVGEGAEAWKALARRAETTFAPFGVPPNNDLTPHITLGRVRGPRGMDDLRAALAVEAAVDCGTQPADRVALIESTLNPAGAIYREIGRWIFSAEPAAALSHSGLQ